MFLEAIATLFVAIVVSLAIYRYCRPARKIHATYTQPGWSLVYYLRYVRWAVEVMHYQHLRPKRLNNYRPRTKDFRYCGVVPTPEEEKLEAPVHLTTDRHEDTSVLWGADPEGRVIYAKVVRLAGRRTNVILIIRDQHGQLYTTPNQPDSTVFHTDGNSWRGAGLLLECVQPMRTWRLKFNGFLRKGSRTHYNSEVCSDDDKDVVEARLDLVWRAIRAPVDLFRDSSPFLLAEALAREPDADHRYFTSLDRDGYDQQGALAGTVQLDVCDQHLGVLPRPSATEATSSDGAGSPTGGAPRGVGTEAPAEGDAQPWFLRGGRQHRWGMGEAATNLHRSVDLLNILDNGDCFYLHTFCYPASLTHCTLGYLQTVRGDYYPLSACSFNMADVGEEGTLPSHIIFTSKAGHRTIPVCIKLSSDFAVYFTGDPWTLQHDISFTESFVGENKGGGVAIFTRSFSELCPVPEQEIIHMQEESDDEEGSGGEEEDKKLVQAPVVQAPLVQDPVVPLVAAIMDQRCRDPLLAGGKGSSLAVLSALLQEESPEQFTVPAGIIVTTEAWRRHLCSVPALATAVHNIEKAVGSTNESQIKDACHRASEQFRRAGVSEEVRQAITGAIQELYDDRDPQIRFAVRSSGCEEDGSEASVAGQNLTVLATRGLAQVLAALPSCWASLLDYTSVQYRRQRGLEPVGEMGVVIQEMVSPDVAGVIFTRHPVTGSPSSITITANYGLGESVVSGAADPDTVTVRRTWRDVLTVARTDVGGKATRHVIRGTEGTAIETVPETSRSRCCVDETLALRLARLALHVEKVFGSPRDIEFAVSESRLFLLQARPITGLESWSQLELQLELDNALLSDYDVLTRANTGEVFPCPSRPLTLSVVCRCLDLAIQLHQGHYGVPMKVDPANNRCITTSHLYSLINVMEVLYRSVGPKLDTALLAMDFAVFGHQVTTERYRKMAVKRNGLLPLYYRLRAAFNAISMALLSKRKVAHAKLHFGRYSISTGRTIKAQLLYAEICRRLPDLIQIGEIHGSVSSSSSFSQTIALGMLAGWENDISQTNVVDMASLLSSCCEGKDSAGVAAALMDLASVIAEDEEQQEFLSMPPDEGCVWLRSHPGLVGEAYQSFLDQHGHRCFKEFMLESMSWSMDGCSLVSSLQSMVASPESITLPCATVGAAQCVDNLQSTVTQNTRKGLRLVVPLLRATVQRREATKSLLIRTVDAFRGAYRTLGALLVSEGRMPECDLVYYLQHYEIELLLQRRTPALIAKAMRRRRLVASMESIQLPELSEGRPQPIRVGKEQDEKGHETERGETVVRGTPVCLGTVRGRARVMLKVSDAHEIQTGDILVTYSTDVGWTPFFPLLAGVVTEIGGLISHGAVVAREYGLPCVVGAAGATQALRSGDIIELDGEAGTITRILTSGDST